MISILNKSVYTNIGVLIQSYRKIIYEEYFFDNSKNRKKLLREKKKFKKLLFTLMSEIKNRKFVVEKICLKITELRESSLTDLEAAYKGDPAANSYKEIVITYLGLYAVNAYRLAHTMYELNVPIVPRLISEHAHSVTGIDIHPGAQIGKYFFIDHGTGIVIGETACIGDNAKLYHGVTLGAKSTKNVENLKGSKRHPTIGNNVTIYAGATILGGDTVISNDKIIKSKALILESL